MASKEVLDFIVIGAQKAGTTSLFEYLKPHPEVCLPAGKEAPYFSDDGVYELGWQAYMRKLALPDPARKWGTVTPRYMAGGVRQFDASDPATADYDERTVARRIHERLPEVKLIAILRDPVERAISHFRMRTMEQLEERSCEQAFGELLEPEMLERARRRPREQNGYVAWGEYGRILGGYLDVFPREQLLVIFTAELEREPQRLLARVEEFIGVRSDFVPDNLGTRYRVGADARRFAWLGPYARFSPQGVKRMLGANARTRAAWEMMPDGLQRRIRRPYERFALQVGLWNRSAGAGAGAANDAAPTPPSEPMLQRLREHYASDTEQLVARTGVTPPWSAPVTDTTGA